MVKLNNDREMKFYDIVCQIDPDKLDHVGVTMKHIISQMENKSRTDTLIQQERKEFHDLMKSPYYSIRSKQKK